MAELTDKTTGTKYKTTKSTDLSASLAAAADNKIDGRIHEFVDVGIIPVRLKTGDQAKFIDLTKVETGSLIRDTERGIIYVPFKKKNFQNMTIGTNSFISTSFDSSAYLDISSSFANKFSSIGDDVLINFLVEEFYTGSEEGFVGQSTASLNTFTSDGLTSSFSGIDSGGGYDMLFDFSNSSYVTNISLKSIGAGTTTLTLQEFIPRITHKFIHTATVSHSIALTTSSLTRTQTSDGTLVQSPASGSPCFVSATKFVDGSTPNSGTYRQFIIKGRVAGDADSGSLYDFLDQTEYVIYSGSVNVSSGSFQYAAFATGSQTDIERITFASSSGDFRTLYYASGSSGGPSGSITGSIAAGQIGSLTHADPLLRTSAASGFYNIPGTTIVHTIQTSSVDNMGVSMGTVLMKVPRFIRLAT